MNAPAVARQPVTPAPLVARGRAVARLGRAAWATVHEVSKYLVKAPFLADRQAAAARGCRAWARRVVEGFGIDLRVSGEVPDKACLLVSNHRSYADIPALGSILPVVFLSRADLRHWPILGPGATLAGTVYVDRNDSSSRGAALRTIERRLDDGLSVVVFPEGTTSAGPGVRAFKPGGFRLAAARRLPVVPVAVFYPVREDAWVNVPLGRHFVERFGGGRRVEAHVVFGPRLVSDDAEELRTRSEEWIGATLARLEERYW